MGRGDVLLDQFAGSGTTILAAEKVGRIAFGIEYEPRTRSNSNDAPQHHGSKSAAAQSHPESASDPKVATAFGGEGGYGGRIAADPESGHA
jgi:DNA methylase